MKGIIINEVTRTLRFRRLRTKPTAEGTVVSWTNQSWLLRSRHSFIKMGLLRHKTFVLLREGDASPLVLRPNGLTTEPYPSSVFDAALKSHIADRVLRSGSHWEIFVMAMLGFLLFVSVVVR